MTVMPQQISEARERIKPFVRKTPLEYSPRLSRLARAAVFLKFENWQHSGSFKPRGSFNRLLKMNDKERGRGIVAPTAGNHGVGLSYAGSRLGVAVNVFLPHSADPTKLAMLEDNNAAVTFFDDVEDARRAAQTAASEQGMTYLSAYNDVSMIEGGGTIGVEVLEDEPEVDLAIVCVGGGGLISGIGTVFKSASENKQVWGVQTESSPQMKASFDAGESISIDHQASIAEGISGQFELDNMTFPLVRKVVDAFHTVSDKELKGAMRWLFENHQVVTEPSAVASVAYLLRQPKSVEGRRIMITITGRNVAPEKFLDYIDNRVKRSEIGAAA